MDVKDGVRARGEGSGRVSGAGRTHLLRLCLLVLSTGLLPAAAAEGAGGKAVLPDSLYAAGLRLMAARRYDEAIRAFERLVKRDRTRAAAFCRLGDIFLLQDRLGRAQRAYEQAVEADGTLAEAHCGLGMTELQRRDGADRAAGHLSRAVELRPGYPEAKIALARSHRGTGRFREALMALAEVVRDSPGDQVRCLPEMALTYLTSGDPPSAAEAFRVYLSKLPSAERSLYEDISLVASAGEMAAATDTAPERMADFIERFWRKRDPTPTTPVNERRVEHHRRVYHALRNFGSDSRPWDRRGEVYIRYGEPDHRSRSDDISLESDTRLRRLKDRLVTLAREGLDEISRPQLAPTAELLGVPVFPTKTDDDWEYWIYLDVAGGIQVVFVSEFRNGVYDYAPIPADSRVPVLWERMLPARVMDRAVLEVPDRYAFDSGPALEFHFDPVTFRGEGGKTRLEVALGLPPAQLSPSPEGVLLLERGIALFDDAWRDAGHVLQDAAYRSSLEADAPGGGLIIDSLAVDVTPGTYRFAVSVKDRLSGRTGLYRQQLRVEGYPSQGLTMSDVRVAGTIRPRPEGRFTRNGLEVIPMPSRAFRRSQAPGFYFEVYNLKTDPDGHTRYRVDYALASATARSVVARILGGGARKGDLQLGARIVASFEQTGETPTANHHVQIDVRDAEPGRYTLTVTVRDRNSREETARRADFLITD